MLIYFSMKITRLTNQMKEVAQQLALVTAPRDRGGEGEGGG